MKHFALILTLFVSSSLTAQNLNFNQSHLTGLYSNPGLTGFNQEQKISLNFRNESPSLSGNALSTFVSYQNGFNRFGSFGAYYLNDYFKPGAFSSNRMGFNYAKPFHVARNLVISAGANVSIVNDHLNLAKLTFGDLYHPRSGMNIDFTDLKKNYWSADLSAGAYFLWGRTFGGFSFNQFATTGDFKMNNFYANLGTNFRTKRDDGFSISPEVSINTIDGFISTAFKVSTFYKWAKLGVEYTNRSQFAVVAGARIKSFDVSLSTEWTVSELTTANGISFELGLSYSIFRRCCKCYRPKFNYSVF